MNVQCLLFKAGDGYVSRRGGFAGSAGKAQVFRGPGEATHYARCLGFAVLSW